MLDLRTPDFYLCESFKDNLYDTYRHTLKELRKNIRRDISALLREGS